MKEFPATQTSGPAMEKASFAEAIKQNPVKFSVNIIFMIISAAWLVYVLPQLVAGDRVLVILFCIIALGADIFKQYSAKSAKEAWRAPVDTAKPIRSRILNGLKATALWSIYAAITAGLLTVSVGYVLTTVNVKAKEATVRNTKFETLNEDIESYKNNIKSLETEQKKWDSSTWQYWSIKNSIEKLHKQKDAAVSNLEAISAVETKDESKRDIYKALGESWKQNPESIKVWSISSIILFIELVLFMTSWDAAVVTIRKKEEETSTPEPVKTAEPEAPKLALVNNVEDESEGVFKNVDELRATIINERDKLLLFVDGLIEDGYNRLNGNQKVVDKTGLLIQECRKYRGALRRITINGKPSIVSVQGTSKANFSRDKIKAAIQSIS